MQSIVIRNENIPMIGVGTWCIGDDRDKQEQEVNCIRTAIEKYGMALIDTAEMYGDGASEAVVGKVLEIVPRDKVFVVSKILPMNARKGNFRPHVLKSLELANCEYFDLYLLHWRADVDLQLVVDEMEALVEEGLIKHWGVSNFDVSDMEELFACRNGRNCFANQFLYNICERGVEYDLIPWCIEHDVMPMIYSPLGDTRKKQLELLKNPILREICERNNISITNLMLRFVVRDRNLVVVFKTASVEHLAENMYNIDADLDKEDLKRIDTAFAPPTEKVPLEKI